MPRAILIEIIQGNPQLAKDGSRLKSMLADRCTKSEEKKYVHAILTAQSHVVPEMIGSQGLEPIDVLLPRLAHVFADSTGLPDELAAWAISAWAEALGIATNWQFSEVKQPITSSSRSTKTVKATPPSTAMPPPPVQPVVQVKQPTTSSSQSTKTVKATPPPTPILPPAPQPVQPVVHPQGEKRAGERMTLAIEGVEYAFRWCPPGTFTMGSPTSEKGRSNGETQHQVTLSHGFWLLETPVTQSMWESVMGNNPSKFKGSKKLPVERVSWEDCQGFIQKLNALLAGTPRFPAGFKFSLPTEAQWEYACRADTPSSYHFGNTLTQQQANFSSRETKDVGSYPANAWGLKDMHGNILEWCQDWHEDYPSGAVTDPTGGPWDRGSARVVRGGSWNSYAQNCRSADRSLHGPPRSSRDTVGLRLSLVFESR